MAFQADERLHLGAEAEVWSGTWFGRPAVRKQRRQRAWRHPDLDHLSYTFADIWGSSETAVDHGNLAHGTLMVGLLAADGHQKGIAPGIKLGIASALGDDGMGNNSGAESIVADAIRWCWQSFGADIISLSLGGLQDQNQTREGQSVSAVRQAIDNGVYVVAAAGNDGGATDDGLVAVPGNVDLVITVGASDEDGNLWIGSSRGSQIADDGTARLNPNQKPEVVAPGVSVISTGNNGEYYQSTGSSISTVFITGILALILEDNEQLKPNGDDRNSDCIKEIKWALKNSSVPLSTGIEHDNNWGYGSVSATAWAQDVAVFAFYLRPREYQTNLCISTVVRENSLSSFICVCL